MFTHFQNSTLTEQLDDKIKRVKHLESRLSLTIEEKTRCEKKLEMLLDELQNIDLSATAKMLSTPEQSPAKSEKRHKHLRKQISSFSFFSSSPRHKNNKDQNQTPKRASSEKDLPETVIPVITLTSRENDRMTVEENTEDTPETDNVSVTSSQRMDASFGNESHLQRVDLRTRSELSEGSKACRLM